MDIRGSLYLAGASQDGQKPASAPVQMNVTRLDFPVSFAGSNQTNQTKQIQVAIQLPSIKEGCDEVQGIELQLDLPVIGNILKGKEEKLVIDGSDGSGQTDDDCICQHDLPFSTVSTVTGSSGEQEGTVVSTRRDFCCEWAPAAAMDLLQQVDNVTAGYTLSKNMLLVFNVFNECLCNPCPSASSCASSCVSSCGSSSGMCQCTQTIRLPLCSPGDLIRLQFNSTISSESILKSSGLGDTVFTDGQTNLQTEFLDLDPVVKGAVTCRYITNWDPQAKPNARQHIVELQRKDDQNNLFKLQLKDTAAVVQRFVFSGGSAGASGAVLVLNGKPVHLDFHQPLRLCVGRLHSVAVLTQTADPDQRIYAVVT